MAVFLCCLDLLKLDEGLENECAEREAIYELGLRDSPGKTRERAREREKEKVLSGNSANLAFWS